MKYLFIVLFLFGCAQPIKNSAIFFGKPTDVTKYLNKLNSDLNLLSYSNINVDYIQFYSQPTSNGKYDGLCSKSFNEVKISILEPEESFNWYTYYLFLHEIGHCHFNKGHIEGPYIMNQYPAIVMTGDFLSDSKRLELLKQMLVQ